MRGNILITTPTAKPEPHGLRWSDRAGLVIASAVGVLALFSGLMMMTSLSSAFRTADIFYQQPVAGYAAWLAGLPRPDNFAAGTGPDDGQATAIADRLLLLPVSPRRAILSAMANDAFWSGLAQSEADRRWFIAVSSRGLDEALSRAPLGGAMWLAAAKLRTLQHGFDATAETYLSRSYVLAPKEAGVAADRLAFTASIRPLLRGEIDADFWRDTRIVCRTSPRRYRTLSRFFALPACDRV
jgi:hypothetical protein